MPLDPERFEGIADPDLEKEFTEAQAQESLQKAKARVLSPFQRT